MILFDSRIKSLVDFGELIIEPFNKDQLGPNSYDVRLSDSLLVYKRPPSFKQFNPKYNVDGWCLDARSSNETEKLTISSRGFVLMPGILYLGATMEVVGTKAGSGYVPHIEGRSSVGRLGMTVHVTAGFGDEGFIGNWTLEITVVHPLRVYAGDCVAQAYFLGGIGHCERPMQTNMSRPQDRLDLECMRIKDD